MTSLAGLDTSGKETSTLSAATEAQPLRPNLFLAKIPESANVSEGISNEDTSVAVQFSTIVGRHRELWRARDVDDPAIGRYQGAIMAELNAIVLRARQLLSQAPDSAMANARLASALLNAGQGDEAAQIAMHLGALPFTDLPAVLIAAQILLQTGHRDAAESLATKVIEGVGTDLTPSVAVTLRCLGAALAAERGDLDVALLRLEDVAGAQAHGLRGYLLLELMQPRRALHELRMARNLSRIESPAVLSNLAYAHAVLGSPAKAIHAARHALVISPGNHLVLKHLTGYLLAMGQSGEAIEALRSAATSQDGLPPDLATALASAFLQAGDPQRALRVLRETAQRLHFKRSGPIERAELRANEAFLAFRLGRLNRKQWLESIRGQWNLAEGRSISIACMLADALARRSGRAEVMQAYERLRAIYSAKQLLPLRARLASLGGDLSEQLHLVQEWVQAVPLDIDALTSEVYILCEFQRYQTAASQGLTALRRFPNGIMLRNNTAYALAMAGDVKNAKRILKPINGSNAYAVATAGLIQLRSSHIKEGLEQYQKAADIVRREAPDVDQARHLMAQLALHLRLVITELHLEGHPLVQENILIAPKINPEWLDEPNFMVLALRAKRLSASLPPIELLGEAMSASVRSDRFDLNLVIMFLYINAKGLARCCQLIAPEMNRLRSTVSCLGPVVLSRPRS
jgi:tetratricopeptide (TPR) repeat protein